MKKHIKHRNSIQECKWSNRPEKKAIMAEVLQPVSWNTSATISTVLNLLIKKMANPVTMVFKKGFVCPSFFYSIYNFW